MDYTYYNQQMHQLFEDAFDIRSNPDSNVNELHNASNNIDKALHLTRQMEQTTNNKVVKDEVINDRLRCHIEQLAIHTRLLRMAYNTPQFSTISQQHEELCKQCLSINILDLSYDIKQSYYQLNIIAYQSLSANYFRQSNMGMDKDLCKQAISYIDKAIELTQDNGKYAILQNNKQQLVEAMNAHNNTL